MYCALKQHVQNMYLPLHCGKTEAFYLFSLKISIVKKILSLLLVSFPLFVFSQKTKLVWSDEFNYKGHPDPKKWGYEEGYVRHNELQYYTVNRLENARVENGSLLIELRKETPQSF